VPLMAGEETHHRLCYMEYPLAPSRIHYALFDGRYKIIRKAYRRKSYFFDLEEDPGEKRKLGKHHEMFRPLIQKVERYRAKRRKLIEKLERNQEEDEPVMPEETRSALKEMGYIE
jgi:hypothetical protein